MRKFLLQHPSNSFALLAFWTWHYSTQKVCYFFPLTMRKWLKQSKRPNRFDLWFQRVQHGQEGMGTQMTPSILTGTSSINSHNSRSIPFRSRDLGTTTSQTAPPAEDQCSSPCAGGGISHSNHDGGISLNIWTIEHVRKKNSMLVNYMLIQLILRTP